MAGSRKLALLEDHVARLVQCRRCPRMVPPPVSGGAIISDVMIIGQAPGVREPVLKRPFAHTAGKTLFRWFEEFCGLDEAAMRARIYFDLIPLPHPSGASPWHKLSPGRELLAKAMRMIARHPAMRVLMNP